MFVTLRVILAGTKPKYLGFDVPTVRPPSTTNYRVQLAIDHDDRNI